MARGKSKRPTGYSAEARAVLAKKQAQQKATIGDNGYPYNNTEQWYENVQSEKDITEDLIARVYKIDLPICPQSVHAKKKQNCKENPNCLFGLGEKQIGQSSSNDIANPNELKREDNALVGLKNLGATCYMNSLLQALFMNTSFRQGIYSWNNSLQMDSESRNNTNSDSEVISQLQLLFGHLQYGIVKYYDPSKFVRSIQLNTAIQQDPQEFFKLFMSLLESRFEHTNLGSLISTQFQGKCRYSTQCQKCLNETCTHSPFYEIELSIKGMVTLADALTDYLKPENLTGTDQYLCENCKSKQDAVRKISISQLPQVINFQLLRFVYDKQLTTKKKVRSKFSFPLTLGMSPYVGTKDSSNSSASSSDNDTYELSAVLIHKGASAYGGHYIAHIRDETTNKWWTFDDETVQILSQANANSAWKTEELDGESVNPADDNQKEKDSEKESENENTTSLSSRRKKKQQQSPPKGFVSSCNAYMLMYTRKDRKIIKSPEAPKLVALEIQKSQDDFASIVKSFVQTKEDEKRSIQEHKLFYDKVIASIHPGSSNLNEMEYCFINVDWLACWIKSGGKGVPKINNTNLLCSHGKLDPSKVPQFKRISKFAWEALTEKFGVEDTNTVLCSTDANVYPCLQCIKQIALDKQNEMNNKELKAMYLEMLTHANSLSTPVTQVMYWVNKAWLAEWRKKEPKFQNGLGVTTDILCSHGELTTDESSRKQVPETVWQYVFSLYGQDSMPIPVNDHVTCPQCLQTEEEQRVMEDVRKVVRNEEKEALHELYAIAGQLLLQNKQTLGAIPAGTTYYLVSSKFVKTWKSFVDNIQVSDADKPDMRHNQELLCHHSMLKYDITADLLDFLHSPSKGQVGDSAVYVIVSEQAWNKLILRYPTECIIKIQLSRHEPQTNASGKSELNSEFSTHPQLCSECAFLQQEEDKRKKLHFTDSTLTVILLPLNSQEEMQNDESNFQPVNNSRRKKKHNNNPSHAASNYNTRSKGTAGKSYMIKHINSSQTLQQIKLLIYQQTDIPPFQQKVVKLNGEAFMDMLGAYDDMTLSEIGLVSESTLVIQKIEENDHYLADDSQQLQSNKAKSREPEQGFKGTALHSIPISKNLVNIKEDQENCLTSSGSEDGKHLGKPAINAEDNDTAWSCQQCTFRNPKLALQCEICGTNSFHNTSTQSSFQTVLKRSFETIAEPKNFSKKQKLSLTVT